MRYWTPRKVTGRPRVGVAVAAYAADPRRAAALHCLVHSFRAQTYPDWQLLVVHDGPTPPGVDLDSLRADDRVTLVAMPDRKQAFGHPYRQWAVEQLLNLGCQWVGLTNDDNYYVPTYLEWMLALAQEKKADLVHCDCVHSHREWHLLVSQLKRGHIDLGGFLATAALVRKVKFDKVTFAADWDYISRLKQTGCKTCRVPAALFVHN